jgi:serine/threonine-protein kinase
MITTQKLTIDLTDYSSLSPAESVEVKVILYFSDKTETVVYEGTNMSDDSFTVKVEGYGRQVYEVFIDGVSAGTGYIDF